MIKLGRAAFFVRARSAGVEPALEAVDGRLSSAGPKLLLGSGPSGDRCGTSPAAAGHFFTTQLFARASRTFLCGQSVREIEISSSIDSRWIRSSVASVRGAGSKSAL